MAVGSMLPTNARKLTMSKPLGHGPVCSTVIEFRLKIRTIIPLAKCLEHSSNMARKHCPYDKDSGMPSWACVVYHHETQTHSRITSNTVRIAVAAG